MKKTNLTFMLVLATQLLLTSATAHAFKEPNGNSVGLDVYCPKSSLKNDLIACYSTAELTSDVFSFRTGKKKGSAKIQLVTRVEENDELSDSLGVGYCTAKNHRFHVNQDIIVDNKVLYPFADFYVNSLQMGVQQEAYEWDSEMAECVSNYNFVRNSADQFTIISKDGKPVDFGNIVYKIQNSGKISYKKIK